MQILIETQILLGHSGFGINTNILETNLINQLILIPILIAVWKGLDFGGSLNSRRENIANLVQDSEKRLSEATERLDEVKKQLTQAFLIVNELQKETNRIKLELLDTDLIETKNELNRRFGIATTTIKIRERLMVLELKQKLSFLALQDAIIKIEKEIKLGSHVWTVKYLEDGIKMLDSKGSI